MSTSANHRERVLDHCDAFRWEPASGEGAMDSAPTEVLAAVADGKPVRFVAVVGASPFFRRSTVDANRAEDEPDRWTLGYLNDCLEGNDSDLQVERVEEDGKVRYDVRSFGFHYDDENFPKEGLVVKSYPYEPLIYPDGERFMVRNIARDLLNSPYFFFDALSELAQYDPRRAQTSALVHLSGLLATVKDFVVYETFGLEKRGETTMRREDWARIDADNAAWSPYRKGAVEEEITLNAEEGKEALIAKDAEWFEVPGFEPYRLFTHVVNGGFVASELSTGRRITYGFAQRTREEAIHAAEAILQKAGPEKVAQLIARAVESKEGGA